METTRSKVLLIEDDPLHVQIIEGMIVGKQSQFELLVEENLADALRRLSQEAVALVLLDLTLPDSGGVDTFTDARSAPEAGRSGGYWSAGTRLQIELP